jgi:hypothetical protein
MASPQPARVPAYSRLDSLHLDHDRVIVWTLPTAAGPANHDRNRLPSAPYPPILATRRRAVRRTAHRAALTGRDSMAQVKAKSPAVKAPAKPEDLWHEARLIPTTSIGGQADQEQRATSAAGGSSRST